METSGHEAGSASRTPRRRLGRRGLVLGAVVLAATIGFALNLRDASIVNAARDAKRLIEAGAFQEAAAPLDHWLAARPGDPEARFFAARREIGLQHFDEGLRGLQSARKLGHPAIAVDREQGIVLSRIGRHAEAEPILRRAFRRAVAHGERDVAVDQALARCYLETFQLRQAEAVVNRWIADDSGDARAYYWKGEIDRRRVGAPLDALIADYEQAVRLDPSHEQARLALAELQLRSHHYDDAAALYEIQRNARPEDVEALLGLGRVASARGEDDEAVRCFERAAEVAPKDFRSFADRGGLELKRGRFKEALEYLDQAVARNADQPDVHYQRSLVLTWLGRADEARKEKEDAARLRTEQQEVDSLLDALRKSPLDPSCQYAVARWLFEHGHPEEGLKWAEKNVREHPGHADTHRLLADYYQRRGDAGLANAHKLLAGDR